MSKYETNERGKYEKKKDHDKVRSNTHSFRHKLPKALLITVQSWLQDSVEGRSEIQKISTDNLAMKMLAHRGNKIVISTPGGLGPKSPFGLDEEDLNYEFDLHEKIPPLHLLHLRRCLFL